jgi:hypothetical protein
VGFTKLDDGLIFSSILAEDDAVFKVWVLILSRTDGDGVARISPAFLASVTRKTDGEVERCLQVLESPDARSRSLNDDGRRIQRVDGGYKVLNYSKYRQRADVEDVRAYERERKARQRAASSPVPALSGTEAGRSASASASASVGEGSGEREPALPPADFAERAIRKSTDALRTRLYALITEMAREDPEHADPSDLMRMVTAYDKPDGTRVKGVVNAAMLTHERLERSITDAEAQLAEWRRPADDRPPAARVAPTATPGEPGGIRRAGART